MRHSQEHHILQNNSEKHLFLEYQTSITEWFLAQNDRKSYSVDIFFKILRPKMSEYAKLNKSAYDFFTDVLHSKNIQEILDSFTDNESEIQTGETAFVDIPRNETVFTEANIAPWQKEIPSLSSAGMFHEFIDSNILDVAVRGYDIASNIWGLIDLYNRTTENKQLAGYIFIILLSIIISYSESLALYLDGWTRKLEDLPASSDHIHEANRMRAIKVFKLSSKFLWGVWAGDIALSIAPAVNITGGNYNPVENPIGLMTGATTSILTEAFQILRHVRYTARFNQ